MAQKSERIADEEIKCQHMADLAQNDLNEALPALEEAIKVSVYNVILLQLLCKPPHQYVNLFCQCQQNAVKSIIGNVHVSIWEID